MRRWVCRLQLLLAPPSQSFSSPSPPGIMTTFYCLRFNTPPTWKARSPYLYPPGTGWPSYTPTHQVPFLSPPTTHRAMVEVFESASTSSIGHYIASGWTVSKTPPPTIFYSCIICSLSPKLVYQAAPMQQTMFKLSYHSIIHDILSLVNLTFIDKVYTMLNLRF
jgi:hypothetical protein